MTSATLVRETIVLERILPATPMRAFAAWADPTSRATWSAPSADEVVIYDAVDFRVGGMDASRCGPRAAPAFHVAARYLDIVEGERIVFTETVVHAGATLSHALITVAFAPHGAGETLLRVTDQIVATGDARIIDGNRNGLAAALGNLVRHLADAGSANQGDAP